MNRKEGILWIIAGLTGLALFCLFFRQVFPTASIDIKITRNKALYEAVRFIKKQGFGPEEFDYAVRFASDYIASVYLQNIGIKNFSVALKEDVSIWFWRVKLFKELKKRGFIVDIDPSKGKVIRFYYSILENARGKNLDKDTAYRIAKDKLRREGIDLGNYILMDSVKKIQKNRTDYAFVWEKKGFKIKEATLRIRVDIYGEKLGFYRKYLKVPEEFLRKLEAQSSGGKVLYMVSIISTFILIICAVFNFLLKPQPIDIKWRIPFVLGSAVVVFKIISFLNGFPLMWSFYSNTVSKSLFIAMSFQNTLIDAFYSGFMVFSLGVLGSITSQNTLKRDWTILERDNLSINASAITSIIIVGYSLGVIFLGYITLFYLIGGHFFHIWMVPSTRYANFLSTFFPFLYPLTFSLEAALGEEFMFRMFLITFLLKYTKKPYVALLISALLWGFAHSTYPVFPVYIRAIELTIFGYFMGWVFIKYGIEAVIIAHYTMDALLIGIPLFNSKNFYFIFSGIIVLLVIALPLFLYTLRGYRFFIFKKS